MMTSRTRSPSLLTRSLLTGAGLALICAHVIAALPPAVDGEPLPTLAPMLDRTTPGVVNVASQRPVRTRDPIFDLFFDRRLFNVPGYQQERIAQSLGSGVIVDANRGLILTSNHVIANADSIKVNLNDGREFDAELVGADPDTDVAVIRIPAQNLTAIPMADSDQLRVGDFVVAIGNPFNVGQTVTSGIISALARSVGIVGYEDFIQTDASINQGNSGGALVNLRGELVGINTAIISESGGSVGIGFAIPVNLANQVMEQLVEHGTVRRGFLGAEMVNLYPALAHDLDINGNQGALVVNVALGSPAARAGLQPGDVITQANGRTVRSRWDVENQVGITRSGDPIRFQVLRGDQTLQLTAAVNEGDLALLNEALAGAEFIDIAPESNLFGRVQGVVVNEVEAGSTAWNGRLRKGDIITGVNGSPVRDLRTFLAAVNEQTGKRFMLNVIRGNERGSLMF